jgi:carboxypeptidase Taq
VSYEQLRAHYRRIGNLTHVSRIVGWDEAVMMPAGGSEARADALATLEGLIHELGTMPHVADLIAAAKEEPLGDPERAGLREIERVYVRATLLPQRLVEAQSRAQLRCEQAWRAQRKESDFEGHAPLLEEVVALKREEAQLVSERLGVGPYEALLDAYEPGMRTQRLDGLFGELSTLLTQVVPEVIERQAREPVVEPHGPCPRSESSGSR